MLNITLASNNAHKLEEFNQLFDPSVIKIVSAPQKIEVIEDGINYVENAQIKAKAYYQLLKSPVMSDDSGLNVSALPEELGIHSARFGGEGLSDRDRVNLLLEKLKDNPNRDAYFTCLLCFYLKPEEVFFFEGRLEGTIAEQPAGDQGFGYDPIFIPKMTPQEGSTLAMLAEWKNEHSHRAVASKFALKFFQERVCQTS